MEKEKILFINGHLNVGGVERSLVDILRHIDYGAYDVTLVLLEELGDFYNELPCGLKTRLVDLHNTYGSLFSCFLRCLQQKDYVSLKTRLLIAATKLFGSPVYRLGRKTLFGKEEFDSVIGFRPGICTDLAAFSVKAHKRYTWWHHGDYLLSGQADKNYRKDCQQLDGIVAVSQFSRSLLSKHYHEQGAKISIIPNMVDPVLIQEKANETAPYQKDGTIHIVSVGGLYEGKHFDNIIPVAQKLLANGIDRFLWYLIGEGPEWDSLCSLINVAHLSDHILMVGKQSNPYPWMKNADLFVHPSHIESQGIVIIEAMALGVPCVVARSPGPLEFIMHGTNGLLADLTADDLADKVLQILSDPVLYASIKANTSCPHSFLPTTVINKIENTCF